MLEISSTASPMISAAACWVGTTTGISHIALTRQDREQEGDSEADSLPGPPWLGVGEAGWGGTLTTAGGESEVVAVNVVALLMCVYDKRAAIKRQRRVSEKALFVISIIGGAAGMLAGMLLVRHKTRHWQFMVFVPLLIVVHVVIIVVWLM